VNRALRRISIAVLVMFVLLLININYLQGFEPASLATKPNNARAFEAQFQYQRGSIITSDGVTIAESRPSNDIYKYQRYYPHGPEYAPITGYDTLYSQSGIEYYKDSVLNGSDSSLTVRNLIDLLTGKQREGANVTVTINSQAQNAAWTALQQTTGAVVALDPQTGAILAMASYPSYDPNVLATHNGNQLNAVDEALLRAPGNPLLNRAINYTWPPGSTFKIVTSSAYLTQNPASSPQTSVYSPTVLTLPQTTHKLTNNDGEVCGDGSGQAPLITAFAQSCDTTFGSLGMTLTAPTLDHFATLYGMNSDTLRIPMPVSASNYVIPPGNPPSPADTAFSAIGQFSDTVTPLQEAMFAAAIANGGKLMTPYLVKQVTASDLSTVQTTAPTQLSQAVSPAVAADVGKMMLAVVQDPDGTANAFNTAAVGFTMAGKTGTAQNGVNNTNLNDAVFTSYAPFDNPQIAVGVIIQGGGYGATAAAPIAVQVIKAYLATLGK
jgi:penicillin-binding protein A